MRGNRIGLIAHRDARLAVRSRPLERSPDDSRHAVAGVDLFRDVLVAARTATAEILAFGVFSENRKVDCAGALENAQVGMKECDRPEIDVQIQSKPKAQQNVTSVLVTGHARISQGSEKDRVDVITQVMERGVGQRFFGLEVMISGIR